MGTTYLFFLRWFLFWYGFLFWQVLQIQRKVFCKRMSTCMFKYFLVQLQLQFKIEQFSINSNKHFSRRIYYASEGIMIFHIPGKSWLTLPPLSMSTSKKLSALSLNINVHRVTYVLQSYTVCPRSSDQFHIVSYYIEWVTTSWTYRRYIQDIIYLVYRNGMGCR